MNNARHSHPALVQYNLAWAMIEQRRKAAKRRAGIYNPNGKNYPMPEDGTEAIDRKLSTYYWHATQRAFERCQKDAPAGTLV